MKTIFLKNIQTVWQGKITLIILLIVGLILRIKPAFTTDLWGDEAISFLMATKNSFLDLLVSSSHYHDFVHPPFYYFLLKLGLLFSNNQYYLRSISIVFFVLTFLALYKIGKRLQKDVDIVVILLLFSVHPFFVDLGFQVRMYSLVLWLNCVGVYYAIVYLQENKNKYLVFSSFALGLGFYTDYLTVWTIIALAFFSLYLFLKRKKTWVLVSEVIGIVALLVVWPVVVLLRNFYQYPQFMQPGSLPGVFTFEYLRYQFLRMLGLQSYDSDWVLVVMFLLLALLVANAFWQNKEKNKWFSFFTLLGIVPIFITIFVSIVLKPIFLARNLVMVMTAILFLVGFGFKSKNLLKIVAVSILVLFFTLRSWSQFDFYFTRNHSTFVQSIVSKPPSKGVVVQLHESDLTALHDYYFPVYGIDNSQYLNVTSVESAQKIKDFDITSEVSIILPYDCSERVECTAVVDHFNEICTVKNCTFYK